MTFRYKLFYCQKEENITNILMDKIIIIMKKSSVSEDTMFPIT